MQRYHNSYTQINLSRVWISFPPSIQPCKMPLLINTSPVVQYTYRLIHYVIYPRSSSPIVPYCLFNTMLLLHLGFWKATLYVNLKDQFSTARELGRTGGLTATLIDSSPF